MIYTVLSCFMRFWVKLYWLPKKFGDWYKIFVGEKDHKEWGSEGGLVKYHTVQLFCILSHIVSDWFCADFCWCWWILIDAAADTPSSNMSELTIVPRRIFAIHVMFNLRLGEKKVWLLWKKYVFAKFSVRKICEPVVHCVGWAKNGPIESISSFPTEISDSQSDLSRAGSNNVPFMSHLLYSKVVLSISGSVEILMCFSTTRPSSLLCLQHFLHFQLDFFLSDPGVPGPIYGFTSLSQTEWDTLCKLNWCDSSWWRYNLNTNW